MKFGKIIGTGILVATAGVGVADAAQTQAGKDFYQSLSAERQSEITVDSIGTSAMQNEGKKKNISSTALDVARSLTGKGNEPKKMIANDKDTLFLGADTLYHTGKVDGPITKITSPTKMSLISEKPATPAVAPVNVDSLVKVYDTQIQNKYSGKRAQVDSAFKPFKAERDSLDKIVGGIRGWETKLKTKDNYATFKKDPANVQALNDALRYVGNKVTSTTQYGADTKAAVIVEQNLAPQYGMKVPDVGNKNGADGWSGEKTRNMIIVPELEKKVTDMDSAFAKKAGEAMKGKIALEDEMAKTYISAAKFEKNDKVRDALLNKAFNFAHDKSIRDAIAKYQVEKGALDADKTIAEYTPNPTTPNRVAIHQALQNAMNKPAGIGAKAKAFFGELFSTNVSDSARPAFGSVVGYDGNLSKQTTNQEGIYTDGNQHDINATLSAKAGKRADLEVRMNENIHPSTDSYQGITIGENTNTNFQIEGGIRGYLNNKLSGSAAIGYENETSRCDDKIVGQKIEQVRDGAYARLGVKAGNQGLGRNAGSVAADVKMGLGQRSYNPAENTRSFGDDVSAFGINVEANTPSVGAFAQTGNKVVDKLLDHIFLTYQMAHQSMENPNIKQTMEGTSHTGLLNIGYPIEMGKAGTLTIDGSIGGRIANESQWMGNKPQGFNNEGVGQIQVKYDIK